MNIPPTLFLTLFPTLFINMVLSPLILPPPTYHQVEPLLDSMWHYECIVSPKPKLTTSPNASTTTTSPYLSNQAPPQVITLSPPEQRWLQIVFHTFDENRDGKLTHEELVRSMQKLGICMPHNSVVRLLSSVSPKANEHVDLQEFFLLYQSTCGVMEELSEEETGEGNHDDQDLREAFNVFDKDGDGFISPAELQGVLRDLGFPQGQELSACEEMISKVDEDGNGQVDFVEFKKMMCSSALTISCY